jgi:O-antigen ligase
MRTGGRHPLYTGITLLVPVSVALAWWMGAVVAGGGRRLTVALALTGIGLLALLAALAAPRLRYGALTVELPVVLLVLGTLVLRGRSSEELAANPLDPAGLFRVACVGSAGLLGLAALLSSTASASRRLTSLPFRLYLGYVLVVFAGVPLSVNQPLTAYRGVELVAALLVFLAAWRRVGDEATGRIESTLYWCTVGLVSSIWLGVALVPSKAILPLADEAIPIQYNLVGVFPSLASNAVGTLGIILTVWSLARMRASAAGRLRPRIAYPLAALGFVTLVFAQYRTGYVAATISILLLLLLRRKWGLAGALTMIVAAALVWKPSLVLTAEPYVLRGQTATQAQELSGRVSWWEAALSVWRESPLIGKGLLTATRFEIFARLGSSTTAGLHSTWMEALVGTGLVGLALLALSFLVSLRRALLEALRPHGWVVPAVLLAVIGVRTLTGNTFESFQYEALIFLWLASSLRDDAPPTMRNDR